MACLRWRSGVLPKIAFGQRSADLRHSTAVAVLFVWLGRLSVESDRIIMNFEIGAKLLS